MTGSMYRRGEAVVAVAFGKLLQGRAKPVAALTGERLGRRTRRRTQFDGDGLVRLGEEEIKRDNFRPGLAEYCERAGKESARERPAAERFKAAVVDEDYHHFRTRRANPAQPVP